MVSESILHRCSFPCPWSVSQTRKGRGLAGALLQLFVTGPFTDRCSFIRCVYMQTAQVRLQQSKAGGSVMKHHPLSCSWDPQWLCSFNRITEIASLSPKTAHGILQPFPLPPDMHTPQSSTYLFWLLLEKTLNNI